VYLLGMTALAQGFEILCPDGQRRHFPYHNRGDADSDARAYSRGSPGCGLRSFDRLPDGDPRGACPQGPHTVEPCAFTCPEHERRGDA